MRPSFVPHLFLVLRRIQIFVVAFRVFWSYKINKKLDNWLKRRGDKDKKWDDLHEKNAKLVYSEIVKQEGLWVKAGQYMSTRYDVLPDPYVRILSSLQDSLPPKPVEEVYETIEKEMGFSVKEYFSFFDPIPLATASIAQVHRARSTSGDEIVVKVQHKGIKEIISHDLSSLKTIIDFLAWADKDYDFRLLLNEWIREQPKELDFNLEAENTRLISNNLDFENNESKKNCDESIKVKVMLPTVIESKERVLIMSYMDGIRLNDKQKLTEIGVDFQRLVEDITKSYAHQIYIDGFFNADPHPGNFLVSIDKPHLPILLDFGLTKRISENIKIALAKMLLAASLKDYSMLLSSFSEVGLKFKVDNPEEFMSLISFFFRRTLPHKESVEETRSYFRDLEKKRSQKEKEFKEKNIKEKEIKSLRRNPVDAFPGELLFFMRVLNLLRGISSLFEAKISYLEIMKPFAQFILSSSTLISNSKLLSLDSSYLIENSPILSPMDERLRNMIAQFIHDGDLLGVQVCVYKKGKIFADIAGGIMGKFDPRFVKHDSLFSVFSATKGVTSALLHWLCHKKKISLDDYVCRHWKGFGQNGKENCTIAHALNHRAGLQNFFSRELLMNPMLLCDWNKLIQKMECEKPESLPGTVQIYHYLSFGWLIGGLIEKISGKGFQEVLNQAFTKPLNLEDEFYIGVPPGLESRFTTLSVVEPKPNSNSNSKLNSQLLGRILDQLAASSSLSASPFSSSPSPLSSISYPSWSISSSSSSFPIPIDSETASIPINAEEISQYVSSLPLLFNVLFFRRAVIPSANGHFTARALAKFYACLSNSGVIPRHSLAEDDSYLEARDGGVRRNEEESGITEPREEPLKKQQDLYDSARTNAGNDESIEEKKKGSSNGKVAVPILRHFLPLNSKSKSKSKQRRNSSFSEEKALLSTDAQGKSKGDPENVRLFDDENILHAFLGLGEYHPLVHHPRKEFGLGFQLFPSRPKSSISSNDFPTEVAESLGAETWEPQEGVCAFGHAGMGGSIAFCDPDHKFSVAVLVNQLSSDAKAVKEIVRLVCSELDVPLPMQYEEGYRKAVDMAVRAS